MPPVWDTIVTTVKSFSIRRASNAAGTVEMPRTLPAAGFPTIQSGQLVEEEELPDYKPDRFYPVRLGEIFRGRYQAIAKLGFGTSSTTWLARDLK
jgi:hypothetical protein